jgi:hypothetical protein
MDRHANGCQPAIRFPLPASRDHIFVNLTAIYREGLTNQRLIWEVEMRIVRFATIAAIALTMSAGSAFAGQRNINKRQARQQHRIAEGIEKGSLTPRETAQLERQEARIAALEAKDRRSGGGLSFKERAELERLLNTESHRIYRQKHDAQGR